MTLFTCFLINWFTYMTVQLCTEKQQKDSYHTDMNLFLGDILTSYLLAPPKHLHEMPY